MKTMPSGRDVEPIVPTVGEISALAEHARLHGPAPDCAARMDAVIERRRTRIDAARTIEGEVLRGQGDAA